MFSVYNEVSLKYTALLHHMSPKYSKLLCLDNMDNIANIYLYTYNMTSQVDYSGYQRVQNEYTVHLVHL